MLSSRSGLGTACFVRLLVVGMLGLIGSISIAVAAARIGPINMSGTAGATLDIPIGFTSSDHVSCLQFDLLYDPSRVSLGSARTGLSASGHRVDSAEQTSGRQRVVLYSTTLASLDGGYIVQIPVTWTIEGDSGLDVAAVQLASPLATSVSFASSDLTPTITSNAPAGTAPKGSDVALEVEPIVGNGVAYEWFFNGGLIAGATAPQFNILGAEGINAGTYRVVISVNGLNLTSQEFILTIEGSATDLSRLINLSARGLSQSGDSVLIPGFVIQGTTSKRLLLRAVGPTLNAPPINFEGTVIPDPRMVVKRLNFTTQPPSYEDVDANDDWQTNLNAAEIATVSADLGAFALADPQEAALLIDLSPGQYTVIASDANDLPGIAIVELYDADDATVDSRLINISNRGFCGVGDQVMIPGFVVSAEGPKTLLVRVVGPTLGAAPFNVPGTMADPKLEIYPSGATTPILANDNWGDNPDSDYTAQVAQQVSAFPLAVGSADAAFVVTLPPGSYTVVGSSATTGGTGVVLVEVYVVP